uniref:Uncharacterized protein n=1 Tax=Arion vulgaris TaxID=1028688 RepID=A0A0B7AQB2_9EUPU
MIDCPSQLPRQLRPKLQLFSSFNQSPHYSSQVSPNHSLELYKIEGMSGSTQELKSNTGCGSWHARHSHTSGCLLAHPSPYTHTQESKSCLQVMKSVTSKDSFGQHFHGSLLQTGDRNTSGDSAVSVSGVLVGPDKLSPISLLPSLEQQSWNNTSEDGLTTGMSTTFSPSFSHTPPLSQLPKKIHRSSSPPLVNLISTSKLKVSSSPRVLTVHKTLNPSPDAIEKSNSAPVDIPQEYERTWIPRCESEQVNRKSSNSPHELNKVCQPLESHSDVASEQQKESLSPDILLSVEQTKNSTNVPTTLDEDDDHLQTRIAAHDVLTNVPNKNQHDLLDATFHTENQHFVQAQVHESAEVNLVYRLQQLPPKVTDHYLMALQQGSEHLREQTISSQRQITELLPHHLSAVLHIQEQCHQTPYQELLQQQHDIQLLQHQQHQENQLQSEHMSQNIQYHPSDVQSADSSDYVEKMEENKENLNKRDRNEVDRNVQMAVVQSRSKGNLHPELKQILGQSHAFSLPLMTALCNDSSLMQASRSQSGSRSSYETSTMRSTDSRLTRLSHDTDSRRWSSCCQAANMADVLMMQSCRPYSWHSEHFELDSQSALPPSDHLPPTSPPNPRSINNKHLNMLNSHQSMLPQKMIVSDPGPSSPRLLTMGGETCWWEAPPSASELDGTLSSWTGIIPYSLPAQASHHMNNHIHHQKMVPHKLSSGGHRDSETSITHKQVMKENIGIA